MAGTTHDTSSHEHFQHAPDQTALERSLNQGMMSLGQYTRPLLIAGLILVVAAVALFFWFQAAGRRNAVAWTAFSKCQSPEDYLALAEKHPDASVGEWSRLEAAKLFLSEGLSQALVNREASDTGLKNAKSAYETLLNKKSTPPDLRQEALYGMATCLEALSDGDNKPAIDAYETLLKEFPNSPHKLWAESRVQELKAPGSEAFYAWFRKQDPKPADRPGPKDIPALDSLIPDLEIPDADNKSVTPEAPTQDGAKAPPVPAESAMPEKASSEKASSEKAGAGKAGAAKTESSAPPVPEEKKTSPAPSGEAKPAAPEAGKSSDAAKKPAEEPKPAPETKPAPEAKQK